MAAGFSVKDALNKNSKAGIDESPKARFRTKDISIFKMYRNTMNFYDLGGIEELAGEILTYGLKQNLELVYEPCESGEYRIVAGERRWLALKLLLQQGYKEFEMATCKLTTPQDDDEEQIEIIIANAYRVKTIKDMIEEEQRLKTSLERMKEAGKKIKGYDLQTGRLRDVISSMLHMSKTKIAQIESVSNNLIPEWKEELDKERLTFSAAYELSGMSSDEQREALGKFMESGELTHKDIKDMKEAKTAEKEAAQVEGQMGIDDMQQSGETPLSYHGEVIGEGEEEQVSESDTDGFTGMNPPEKAAGDDYQTPHPEGITSICYSCTEYETCNVKTGTCTTCDQYMNRAEANKTDEQRYSEEQDAIDKETAKKLREQADEAKMNNLPSEAAGKKYIRVTVEVFERIIDGEQQYLIVKNDKYKEGEEVTVGEFSDGRATGRTLEMRISHMDDDRTSSALAEGYSVINICEAFKYCQQCECFDNKILSIDGMSTCERSGFNRFCEDAACPDFIRRKIQVEGELNEK